MQHSFHTCGTDCTLTIGGWLHGLIARLSQRMSRGYRLSLIPSFSLVIFTLPCFWMIRSFSFRYGFLRHFPNHFYLPSWFINQLSSLFLNEVALDEASYAGMIEYVWFSVLNNIDWIYMIHFRTPLPSPECVCFFYTFVNLDLGKGKLHIFSSNACAWALNCWTLVITSSHFKFGPSCYDLPTTPFRPLPLSCSEGPLIRLVRGS